VNKNLYKTCGIIQVILLSISIYLISFYLFSYDPIFCEGGDDKFTEAAKAAKEIIDANKVNPSISGNNTNIQFQDPNLHVHNPNINVPNSWGTAISQGAGSIGLGATVVAGIRGMSYKIGSMPPVARAAWLATGGLVGAGIFVVGNGSNTYVQNKVNNSNNSNNENNNNSANSIIEEGDSVDNVMNFLYFNLFISVSILFLIILLFYLYRKKKEILLFITWVSLVITSIVSIYLAYNLLEDIGIISSIYQDHTTFSVLKNGRSNENGVKLAKDVLTANLWFSSGILISLDLLFILYMNIKIINKKWNLYFIKRIFGERFYYYFMKVYTYGHKTNLAWMLYGFILLVIANLASIYTAYNIINHIDIITEMYQYSNK